MQEQLYKGCSKVILNLYLTENCSKWPHSPMNFEAVFELVPFPTNKVGQLKHNSKMLIHIRLIIEEGIKGGNE
jgi:hypothetical protein